MATMALTPLLSLTRACGGDGGPADPGDAPNVEDSWALGYDVVELPAEWCGSMCGCPIR